MYYCKSLIFTESCRPQREWVIPSISLLRGKEDLKINFPTPDFKFTVVFYRPSENNTKSPLFGLIHPFLVLFRDEISAMMKRWGEITLFSFLVTLNHSRSFTPLENISFIHLLSTWKVLTAVLEQEIHGLLLRFQSLRRWFYFLEYETQINLPNSGTNVWYSKSFNS